MEEKLSKKQFIELPENKKWRIGIKICGIICYFCAALTFIAVYFFNSVPEGAGGQVIFYMIDVLLLAGFGYFIASKRSLTASIICVIYGTVNYILFRTGYLIIFSGLWSAAAVIKLNSQYKEYLKKQS
ncbi:hypothetical protein IJT93_02355 [bacterium]|nr:hypothetical protein [bacterium]